MNPNDPNVFLLERAAEQLGEALLEQLVFVGGAVAGALVTDPAMPEIRPTQDVDVICSVIARSDYHQLGSQLRQRGFQEDSRPGRFPVQSRPGGSDGGRGWPCRAVGGMQAQPA